MTKKEQEELLLLEAENLLLKSKFDKFTQIKKKISKVWIFLIVSYSFTIITTILIWVASKSIIIKIIWLIIAIPIFLMNGVIFLIKLYRDKNKITSFFIKKLSRNFVIAWFFTDNRRFERLAVRTPENKFKYRKGLYFLDDKCIFLDIDKTPNIFYKFGIPNPLKFNFFGMIQKYLQADDKSKVYDDEGNLIDLSYSSDTIMKFKDDKIFNELHSANSLANNWILLVIIGFILIVVLAIIFKK